MDGGELLTIIPAEFFKELNGIYMYKKHLIQGFLYEFNGPELNGRRETSYIFSNDNTLKKLLNDDRIPQTNMQRLERLLLNFYKSNDTIGNYVQLTRVIGGWWIGGYKNFLFMAYAKNIDELAAMFGSLKHLDYMIETRIDDFSSTYSISPKGFERIEQLLNNNIESKTVFVAMWFDDEVKEAYEKAIEKAIEDKEFNFKAFRVDKKEHNNDITDEIIAGIKQSRFVIADLTGYRGGVYYEAGYAKGLGREVILTCRKNWFDGDPKENRRVHFDVNHLSIITWEQDKLDDFKEAIKNRIKATIL